MIHGYVIRKFEPSIYHIKKFKMKIILIACVSQKVSYRTKAKELYISLLFKNSLAYAMQIENAKIYILSAKHHILDLDDEIDPYDVTLSNIPRGKRKANLKVLNPKEKEEWGIVVLKQLEKIANLNNDEFIFLAGKEYINPLLNKLTNVSNPLDGLKFGQRLKFLKDNTV
jgi:hypothetical protein